jgi:cytochrome c
VSFELPVFHEEKEIMMQAKQLFVRSLQVAAVAGLIIGALPAQANEALAKKNLCMSCHKVEGKLVGPAYKDVAAKYKGNADAMAMLSKKVKEGGKGVWGTVAMPPQKKVSDDDLKAILTWVLSH